MEFHCNGDNDCDFICWNNNQLSSIHWYQYYWYIILYGVGRWHNIEKRLSDVVKAKMRRLIM